MHESSTPRRVVALPGAGGPDYRRPTVSAAPSVPRHDVIDAADVRAALRRCRVVVERHADYLTRLDAILGDGDHGDNLVIGFRAVEAMLDGPAPGDAARRTAPGRRPSTRGSRRRCVRAAVRHRLPRGWRHRRRRADPRPCRARADAAAAADGLARRGRCTVGDKTILDALRPAADAFVERSSEGRVAGGRDGRRGASGRAGDASNPPPRRAARPGAAARRALDRPSRSGRGLVCAPAPGDRRWLSGDVCADGHRQGRPPGPHRRARARPTTGVRRRPARGGCALRPVPAEPADRHRRDPPELAGSVLLELIRLADAAGGALWIGDPASSVITLVTTVGVRTATRPRGRIRGRRCAAGLDSHAARCAARARSGMRPCGRRSWSGRRPVGTSTRTASGSPSSPATSWWSHSQGARLRQALERERHELGRHRRRRDRPHPAGRRGRLRRAPQPGRRTAARHHGRGG